MLLRGDIEVTDPRLGRVPEFDSRSRDYPARGVLFAEDAPLRSKTWPCALTLDQNQFGGKDASSCVGMAFTYELAAQPKAVRGLSDGFAVSLYRFAQDRDEWAGSDYEGSSTLAGAKACRDLGYYSEYRWAFGVDDLTRAVSQHGPVVVGIPWYESMFEPPPNGLVEIDGALAGYHDILVRGHLLKHKFQGIRKPLHVVRLRNSWGSRWGVRGDCYVRIEDLERLLHEEGDCVVPVARTAQVTRV